MPIIIYYFILKWAEEIILSIRNFPVGAHVSYVT